MTTTISKNLINDEFVLNTGDTMTGILTINSTDPLIIFQPVTGGSNIVFRDDTQSGFNRATINSGASGGLNITLNDGVGVLQTQLTFTTDGNVTVSGATPNAIDHLTRKDYVDVGLLTQPSKLNRSSGGADLDTLVTGGIYAVLNSQTNYPISGVGSGVLHVMAESSARITQHCRIINSQRWNNLTYIRSSTDSGATWTTWNNIPSVIAVPATITTSGKLGNLAISSTHLYVCTATDTWRRVALSTW